MTRRGWPLAWHVASAVMAAAILLVAPPARSEPASGQIVLLDPSSSSTVLRRAMTRIREELLAGGFDVTRLDPGPRRDPASLAELMAKQDDAVAVVALVGDPEQPGAEIWILDRIGSSPEVRRLPVPAAEREQLPEVLAIRTIEVLKASALKRLLESKYPPAPPPPPPPAPPPPPHVAVAAPVEVVEVEPAMRAFGLETGISVLESVQGPGPAALPLVRARFHVYRGLFARVTVAGLGTRPRIHADVGSTSVDQSVGLAELGFALRFARRWRATVGAGGGALYLRSEGEGNGSNRGLHEDRLVGVVDVGAGLLADLGRQLSLSFEVHGLLALPHPTLRFYDVEAATVGYPALFASLTMVAWL